MKIKNFKLTNFAGIKYGINNDTFELNDIPDGIVLLKGNNGCGKSTTLKTLHVFSDDKDCLIKNDDDTYIPASKELDVEHNGNTYHIMHQYNNKGGKKSFISKNNEELNSNGNVGTFEDIIYKEFGFENNTISNSVIGVSALNFIDLTSSKRKEEISTLLPNISDYEKLYKQVKDTTNSLNKQVQTFAKLISENGSKDILNKQIDEITLKLEPIFKNVEELKQSDLEYQKNLAVIESKYQQEASKLHEIKYKLDTNHIKYQECLSVINKFNHIKKIETDVSIIKSKQDVVNNNFKLLQDDKQKYIQEKNQMDLIWSNYIKDVQYNKQISNTRDTIQKNIEDIQLEISDIKQEVNTYSNIKLEDYMTKDISELITIVGVSIKNEVNDLKNSYTYSINDKSEFDLYEDINTLILFKNQYLDKEKELENIRSNLSFFRNIGNNISSNIENSDKIKMSDGCSLSKCAIQYKNVIDKFKIEEKKLEDLLNKNKNKYEQTLLILNVYDRYKDNYHYKQELSSILKIDIVEFNLRNHEHILNKLREIKKHIDNTLKLLSLLPEKQVLLENKEKKLKEYINQLNNTKLLELKELSFNKEDIVIKENQIKDKDKELLELKKKLNTLDVELNLALEYSKLDKYTNFKDKYEESLKEKEVLQNNLLEIEKNKSIIVDSIKTTRALIQSNTNNIEELNKELETLKNKLIVIDDYIKQKDLIESSLEDRNLVAQALHITKGIPSLLVKEHLVKIEKQANYILDKTFNGAYQLYLDNLEKDFFIRVYEKSTERYIKDVSLCSSGQQAIIKLVLSISLNKASVGDNNYIRLDECDSVLSKENLEMVEMLLNSLLNQFGIEQVFIVTHNSSVSVSDMVIEFDRINMNYNTFKLKS